MDEKIKIEYPSATDTVHFWLPPLRRHSVRTIDVGGAILVHVDAQGAPVVLEIREASTRYPAPWLAEINDPELTLFECVDEAERLGITITAGTLRVQVWNQRIASRKRDDGVIVVRRSELHRYFANRTQGRRTDLEKKQRRKEKRIK